MSLALLMTISQVSLVPQQPAVLLRAAPAVARTSMPIAQKQGVESQLVEQLVDNLAGSSPNLFGTDPEVKALWPLVPLRIAAGLLMIHHGSEGGFWPANVGSPGFDGFVDFIVKPYFGFLPGDPVFWSAIHDYIEFWGGLFIALGFLTRPSAGLLFVTMLGAVYFHLASTGLQGFPFGHVDNYSYNWEEPALYALIYLTFFVTGAGAVSVDEKIAEFFDESAMEQ